MNTYKSLGIFILVICTALIFIFKLENDILDFFTGVFAAVGLALTFGLFPAKKKQTR
ncbi:MULTISPECIES: hypothetical protein [unclassified Polaribacter]|uniref:hypothetical protein n=1 Tax=unclassified Polaribacter TaxID=196858 RepID=UPI001679DA5B|nr:MULTISPECIES: hypothetical protein [unclassified Polaribacter]